MMLDLGGCEEKIANLQENDVHQIQQQTGKENSLCAGVV